MKLISIVLTSTAILLATASQAGEVEWSAPHDPLRITDNIYFVGTQGIGVYLITTPKGHILLDSSTEKGARHVEANIKRLGFKLKDIKFLIETHAHIDHIGGMYKIKRDTGAKFIASVGDRPSLENGAHDIENVYGAWRFHAVKVDETIKDMGTITLGGVTLTAHLTPGHTRGDTTWTLNSPLMGKMRSVMFYGSTTTAGNVLVGNKTYPNIVADYRVSFQRLKTLHADILLANHPEFVDFELKYQASLRGNKEAFVDPSALSKLINQSENDFNAEQAKQQGQVK